MQQSGRPSTRQGFGRVEVGGQLCLMRLGLAAAGGTGSGVDRKGWVR